MGISLWSIKLIIYLHHYSHKNHMINIIDQLEIKVLWMTSRKFFVRYHYWSRQTVQDLETTARNACQFFSYIGKWNNIVTTALSPPVDKDPNKINYEKPLSSKFLSNTRVSRKTHIHKSSGICLLIWTQMSWN